MLCKLLSACFIVQLSTFASSSQILEFCADNQLFSFSKEECPGGVLFKKPMELTEPCHCINKYLTAYSTCEYNAYMQSNFSNPIKVCRRFESNRRYRIGGVILRLLQPVGHAKNGSNKIRHNDSKCHNAHKKCKKIATNNASYSITKYKQAADTNQLPHWNKGNDDNNNNEQVFMQRHGHHHRQKRHTSISHVADAKLRERIQETMDLLNDIQSGSSDTIKPKSMSFQLLAKTVQIFNYITPNVIVENEVINSILTLFLKKYAVMELPGYSGRVIADDKVDREMFENVVGSLQECASRASDSSQEFEGITGDQAGISPELQVTNVTVMNNGQCRQVFRDVLTGNQICSATKPTNSPCRGDSGGPLFLRRPGAGANGDYLMQVGIVSFGTITCTRGYPVAYTRITAFLDYINQITGKNL